MYTFSEVYGNNQIIKSLQSSIKRGKISHSYIFAGNPGSGKKLIANTFAKTILCKMEGINPCKNCKSCIVFDTLNHPDILYISSEKESIGVDLVRENINKSINILPYGKHKIIIMERACTMTHAAQNALLKTLEEPPQYSLIILLVNNVNNLLHTILSRCVTYNVGILNDSEMLEYLNSKNIKCDPVYLSYAQGNIGVLNKLLEDHKFNDILNFTVKFLFELNKQSVSGIFKYFKILESYKEDISTVLEIMQLFLRDCIVLKQFSHIKVEKYLILKDFLNLLYPYIQNSNCSSLIKKLEAVNFGIFALRQNANFQLAMEVMLFNIRKNEP